MSNPFYNPTGNPATGSEGLSALMRAEFINIGAAFDLMPVFTSNGGKAVVVNGGGTGLTLTTGTFALAGNFATTGAYNLTLSQSASVTLTLPAVNGTIATLAGTETLTNKTLVAPALGTPASGVLTNCTGTASGLTAGTATNQSGGSVAATTLSASGAVSGAGFVAWAASPPAIGGTAPAAGAFTSLSASGTVSGAGFVALHASPGPIGSSVASTGAFTTLAVSSTISGTGVTSLFASPPAIGGTAAAAGKFTTLSASSTVSGAGFTAWAASPPAIGGTAPAAGSFTALIATTGTFSDNVAIANSKNLRLTDVSGTFPGMTCQSDNNIVFYTTGSTGTLLPVYGTQARTDSPTFAVHYPVVNDTLAGTGNRAVYSDSLGTLTNSASDRTMKQSISPLADCLAVTLALTPVSYNWRDDLQDTLGPQREIGFIAQDVQPLVPEVVGANADGTLSVDYPKLTAHLAGAIQALHAQVAVMQTQIAALQGGRG